MESLWEYVRENKPEVVWLCSECRAFSAINRLNPDRMDPDEWDRLVAEGVRDLILCMRIADFQVRSGRYFVFEHPLYASSWGAAVVKYVWSLPGVDRVRVDMCQFGLQVTRTV